MLLLAVIALGVAGASAALTPVQPLLPVNPEYTLNDWEAILAAQKVVPERCDGCTQGTVPQPDVAGKVASGSTGLRIIGGSVAKAKQFPWQVQVQMDSSYFCGGSVISQDWILSAGHCASGFSQFVIILGTIYSLKTNDPHSLTVASREAYPHEDYDAWLISDDISVIKLPNRVPEWNDYIRPIRLPSSKLNGTSFAGQGAILSGWGRFGTSTVSPSISPILRFVKLAVLNNTDCARYFGSAIRSTNICTSGGTRGPVGACNGDSGGPLTVVLPEGGITTQVGIVSFGTSLGCNKKYPSAYTRVTSYLKWISSKTGIAIES